MAYGKHMDVVLSIGGLLILAWGLVAVFDFHGLGTRSILYVGRTARTASRREAITRQQAAYRLCFGAGAVIIGGVWVGVALRAAFG
jgi:hypothetical protein